MKRRRLTLILTGCLLAMLGSALLFSDCFIRPASWGPAQTIGLEIQAACRDAGTQWMVVVCLASYLVTFLVLERRLPQKGTEGTKEEQSPTQPVKDGSRKSDSTPHPVPLSDRGGTGDENKKNAKVSAATHTSPRPSLLPAGAERGIFFARLVHFCGQNPYVWLIGFVVLVLLRYASDYTAAARSMQPLVFLAGIVFGKGIALWASAPRRAVSSFKFQSAKAKAGEAATPSSILHPPSSSRRLTILCTLTLFLAASALWQPERGMEFFYHGQRRWTGAWDNPNIYGLLMGVGAVLAVGMLALSRGGYRFLLSAFLFSAFGLCGYGLLKSYSRGAWVGTAVGVGFLIWKWLNRAPYERTNPHPQPLSHPLGEGGVGPSPQPADGEGKSFPRLVSRPTSHAPRRNWLPFSILLFSILVLSFWQFRHTESPLTRRLFSAGNVDDFSWRNRVAAWQGAGRMMWAKPLAGFGWGKAEEVYSREYRAARLEETAAIQMNDYLLLGISAGVPALGCLLIYLGRVSWGVWRERAEGIPSPGPWHPVLPTICFAGAIVLMLGFWFDGGLFKLPTAVVFWVLVELCRRRGNESDWLAMIPVGGESVLASRLVSSLAPPEGNSPLPACGLNPLPVRREEGKGEGNQAPAETPKPSKRGPGFFRSFVRVFCLFCGEKEMAAGHSPTGGGEGVPDSSTANYPKHTKTGMALRWLAGIFAVAALGLTALHLGTPQLAVSERTLTLARQWLVPASEKADFEFLAGKQIWSGQSLGTLLEHAHLANYNRALVNWKLDDPLYREFVLSPEIDPVGSPSPGLAATLSPPDGERGVEPRKPHRSTSNPQPATDLNWRRPLWEYFYPRVRKETRLTAAAESVRRQLREIFQGGGGSNSKGEMQSSTLQAGSNSTPAHVGFKAVLELWPGPMASAEQFELLTVAAWRSVGIPARLATSGGAEFWNGVAWQR